MQFLPVLEFKDIVYLKYSCILCANVQSVLYMMSYMRVTCEDDDSKDPSGQDELSCLFFLS